ncbi:MAG: CDGSH iron-sulfur domain-containing protein [Alphaproteobacteria bacterium]
MKISVEKGQTYFLCTCDKSARFPFCDGSHKGTGQKSLPYTAAETCHIIFEKGQVLKSDV